MTEDFGNFVWQQNFRSATIGVQGVRIPDVVHAGFGMNNLLDNDPPLLADQQYSIESGYGNFDVFGRGLHLIPSLRF